MYSVTAKDAIELLHVASERTQINANVPDKRTSEVSRQVEAQENREFLERGFRGVSARQRDMVALYYGLTGESLNLQPIGDRYSVSKERAWQTIADGLKKMKTELSADLMAETESGGPD